MIRFQFNQFKGTITQALIVVKSVEIDDFWTLDMSVSTLDMLISTLDSRQLPRLCRNSLWDFLDLRHPNHFVLAGANNRNVIIT